MPSGGGNSRKSRLQLALQRGTKPGGDLSKELRKLEGLTLRTPAEALAVCRLLEQLVSADSKIGGPNALNAVLHLFELIDVNKPTAYPVLSVHGNPLVLQIVNDALDNPARRDVSDMFYALYILALYLTREGTDAVIRAARVPIGPEDGMWGVILNPYSKEHPQRKRLFKRLSSPLPGDFIAVALLDAANAAKLDGARFPHPFDSAEGVARLETYLIDRDEELFSYASSATEALPFISGRAQNRLFSLALEHPDGRVQVQAARKAAELGRESGIKWLARSCLDVNLSERAKWNLTDLGRADAIPPEAEKREFQVRASFAEWLVDPRELNCYPDEVEIFDHRILNWPPDRKPIEQWLVRFKATGLKWHPEEVNGVGLVGSLMFSFVFAHELDQRPPEDCYAVHCYWEMQQHNLISEFRVEKNSTEYKPLLKKCVIKGLRRVRIHLVAELSPGLSHPGKLIALATATRNGESGWVAIDGPRSRWYSTSEMPTGTTELTVLMIHVGRALLGFTDEPDRRKFLSPPAALDQPKDDE